MELSKDYNPKEVENKIYQKWERSGFFNPDNLPPANKKPFSISMPPPNVTGDLHLGHATGLSIEDMIIRFKRMKGYKTLFLPGTDHAAISTQFMVEKLLLSQGIDRKKIGREKFLKHVWQWKNKFGDRITHQIRQLGISCDWNREHFTMDKQLTEAVQHAFIKMYKDKLIYQGHRIINWCTRCGSALSDLEVKYLETKGKLWYIKYPIFGTTNYITVATTRPETMLGDTAVAVNPNDKRYKNLIGHNVILPIMEREIPIIADKLVDPNFGSGIVKVTPAHDHLDYEIAEKNHLPIINVIDPNGRMTKEAGEFYGQSIQQARQNIIKKLEEQELIKKIENYTFNQARCERCNSVMEFLVSKQWFIKIKPLAEKAIKVVKKDKIKIIPKRFEKIYFHWMGNIRDWCISRQLWWGHRIPIWYCIKCNKPIASVEQPKKCKCNCKKFKKEEDTLDTWFSSGLWTFSTLGWPQKTKDLKTYHPTSVMETSWDILFFWIARMVMLSLYFLNEIPFKTIYIHGLLLDKEGKKMSKSKGTGVDPIPMSEKYGTDAIRLSLVLGNKAGQDFRIYEEKIAGYRNFVNKLWNVSRFILSQRPNKNSDQDLIDSAIKTKFDILINKITKDLEDFQFSEAGTQLYEFVWHEFADWYLEIYKGGKLSYQTLKYIFENLLKLLHPFAPFVTEEIWQHFKKPKNKSELLFIQNWPKSAVKADKNAIREFNKLKEFVTNIRNWRAENKIPAGEIKEMTCWPKKELTEKYLSEIQQLTKIKINFFKKTGNKDLIASSSNLGNLYYQESKVDKKRKDEELKKLSSYIQRIEQKLSNKNFLKKAPKEIVEKEKEKLEEVRNKLKELI